MSHKDPVLPALFFRHPGFRGQPPALGLCEGAGPEEDYETSDLRDMAIDVFVRVYGLADVAYSPELWDEIAAESVYAWADEVPDWWQW